VAQKLVELALAGDATALTLVARSVLPAARPEERRIKLALPPLDSHANLTLARQRVGAAVASGELGLDEAERLMRLLESIETALVEGEKRRLLEDLRAAMAGTQPGGTQARLRLLAQQAELLVEAARQLPADAPGERGELLEGTAELAP
jgi:hypothetical protein